MSAKSGANLYNPSYRRLSRELQGDTMIVPLPRPELPSDKSMHKESGRLAMDLSGVAVVPNEDVMQPSDTRTKHGYI